MNIPILAILSRLDFASLFLLTIVGIVLFYFVITKKVYGLLFFLTLSSAFVGSSVPMLADTSSFARWIILFLLVFFGLVLGKVKLSVGIILFWCYVFLGFVSILSARNPLWQFQRGILLILAAVAIPFAYGDKEFSEYESSFMAIATVASIFSIYSFIPLPSQFGIAGRFAGYFAAAPNFAMILGGLLPFTFWGMWRSGAKLLKFICFIGFSLGIITLIFSGQRAGTIAGIISLIPLIFTTAFNNKRSFLLSLLMIMFLTLLGFGIFQMAGQSKIEFLLSRYSLNSGLSNREGIWGMALSVISENPLLGRGIGAAETVVSASFHNTYLEIWYNAGFLGLIFYSVAQIYYLGTNFVLWRNSYQDPNVRAMLALALGYIIGFISLCMVESVGAAASTLNVMIFFLFGVFVSNKKLFDSRRRVGARSMSLPIINS